LGSVAEFKVLASGSPPPSFQWRKEGHDLADSGRITGSTTSTLVISAVQPDDAGTYSVVVSNALGTVTSRAATLTVPLPPSRWLGSLSGVVLAGGSSGYADGLGLQARFGSITAIDMGPQDRLYLADAGNRRIRVMDASGRVVTLAGTGEDGQRDGPGAEAAFHDLRLLSVDGAGNCYVLDGDALRRVRADGSVTTLETIVIPDFYPPRAGCFSSSAAISSLVASRSGEVYLLGQSACASMAGSMTVGETATRIYHGVGTDRHLEVNAMRTDVLSVDPKWGTVVQTSHGETLRAMARGAAEDLIVYRERVASPTWLQTAEFLGRTPPLTLTGTNVTPAGMVMVTSSSLLLQGEGKFWQLWLDYPPTPIASEPAPALGLTKQVLRFMPPTVVLLSMSSQDSPTGGLRLSVFSPRGRQVRLEQSCDCSVWESRQTLTSTGQDTLEVKLESDRLFLRAVLSP
jgi:hypothetical protein